MIIRLVLIATSLLAGACAMPQPVNPPAGGDRLRKQVDNPIDEAVYLDLIRSMLDQRQYYAALAHVQEQRRLGGGTVQLDYLEAEAQRQLGQTAEADRLYRGLLRGALSGEAYHGLGLLYARTQPKQALAYLKEAARRRPTDAEIRNDYGYALLRVSQYDAALPELATAIELAPEFETARNNLVLLMILRRDEASVSKIVTESGIPPATVERLRRQAAGLQARAAQSRR